MIEWSMFILFFKNLNCTYYYTRRTNILFIFKNEIQYYFRIDIWKGTQSFKLRMRPWLTWPEIACIMMKKVLRCMTCLQYKISILGKSVGPTMLKLNKTGTLFSLASRLCPIADTEITKVFFFCPIFC